MRTDKDSYDAVIIGAGIGGLVCGCYLAKAGMKVLIAEQHFKVGGYCSSFTRAGFTFDAAAHSFGGYRQDGIVRKVFTELSADKKVPITRFSPSDIISTPDFVIGFHDHMEESIQSISRAFPDERKNIKRFFQYFVHPDPVYTAKLRKMTFKQLLDLFFQDEKLKAALAFPLYGNGGLPPSLMSAFIGAEIFTEFLLDGGYYPEGGMQKIPDSLSVQFREFGGELLLSSPVQKITVRDGKVSGIVLEDKRCISARYVISNCDARQTFLSLCEHDISGTSTLDRLRSMEPSLSMFILYCGIKPEMPLSLGEGINYWWLPHYDLDAIYQSAHKKSFDHVVMVRVTPQSRNILAFQNVEFQDASYWRNNKGEWIEKCIENVEKIAVPGLSQNASFSDGATPATLYRYTRNYKGAAYGWASLISQFAESEFKRPSFIQNLFLVGHWTTLGVGIAGVIYSGYSVANLVLKKREKLYN
jgi:phytoene dehydrogenase-like protein